MSAPGDALDYETLVLPLRPQLMKWAMAVTNRAGSSRAHGNSLAEDLVQDTLLHALASWSKFRHDPKLPLDEAAKRWMIRIMRNRFVDLTRRRACSAARLYVYFEQMLADQERTHAEQAARPELIGTEVREGLSPTVSRALDALVPEYREAIVRVDLLDQDMQQVATETGVSIGTVKSRLHRGRRQLAERLSAHV